MANNADICRDMTAVLHKEIPISRYMGVDVQAFTDDNLMLAADLAPNINIHGTAFAGSLYNLCTLAGWSLTMLGAQARDLDAEVVVAEGEIKYKKPVQDDRIIVRAVFAVPHGETFAQFCQTGKSRLVVRSEIGDTQTPSVIFQGDYVCLAKH